MYHYVPVCAPATVAAGSYCFGNSSNPAAVGSPYLDKTASLGGGGQHGGFGGGGCIDHTMGFADVNLPLTKFLLDVLHTA